MIDGRPALGSATHSCLIMNLRMPWGRPRFYLPGEHPAMYRYREAQRCLLEFINRNPSVEFGKEVWEQLQYIEEQLTQFEAGEDQAKQRAWVVCRGR